MITYISVEPRNYDAAIYWLCCLPEYKWKWESGYPALVTFTNDPENALAFKLKFGV